MAIEWTADTFPNASHSCAYSRFPIKTKFLCSATTATAFYAISFFTVLLQFYFVSVDIYIVQMHLTTETHKSVSILSDVTTEVSCQTKLKMMHWVCALRFNAEWEWTWDGTNDRWKNVPNEFSNWLMSSMKNFCAAAFFPPLLRSLGKLCLL